MEFNDDVRLLMSLQKLDPGFQLKDGEKKKLRKLLQDKQTAFDLEKEKGNQTWNHSGQQKQAIEYDPKNYLIE